MRSIKFRAWDGSKMLFNYQYIDSKDPHPSGGFKRDYQYCDKNGRNLTRGSGSSGNHIELQYTGLTDKNGVEIYEGDVVYFQIKGRSKKAVLIEYKEASFVFNMDKRGCKSMTAGCPKIEVIGNIYESPELLNN